jgi:UPF0755 protein
MRRGGCLLFLLLVAFVAAGLWGLRDWGGPGPARQNVTVSIPVGASMATAARALEKAGAIRSAERFVFFARILGSGEAIKAGEYRVLAHLSQADILKMMQGGKTLQRFVTIPEGLPSVLVQDVLVKASELKGSVPVPQEGSVLPDSYAYDRNQSRQAVLTRMQKAMTDYLAAAWERRKPGLAVHTPEEALTLASIVEKETGKPSERRMVAAVYANRLKRGMPLQADPTFIYPITKGRPLGRRPLLSEVHAKNAYNTYEMIGLPIGPICNPGRASIDAVLDPAESSALYFVADGTGGHVFADTLEQHNANVRKWYAIRRARGEM